MSDNRFVIDFDDFLADTYHVMSDENRERLSEWLYWKFESDRIWEEVSAWCEEGITRLGIPVEQTEIL